MKHTITVGPRTKKPENTRQGNLEIHVKGDTFCGKTDITRIIAKALHDAGIDFELWNRDGDFMRGFNLNEPVKIDERTKANVVQLYDQNARPEHVPRGR